MAREEIEVVAAGLDPATFNSHVHPYRKVTQLGVDGVGSYASPQRVAIVDDSEVNVTDSNKVSAVGVTVATGSTGTPA